MMKRLAGVGAALLAGAVLYTQRRRLLARWLGLRPPRYAVDVERNLRVPVAPGVTLAADLYRPRTLAQAATVLIRTPYDRGTYLSAQPARVFAERGYNVLCQDVRGRGASDGRPFEPYVHEAADGRATIDWIVQQPWSNGQVGMWGASYPGYVQWAAASTGTDALQALVPVTTRANLGGPTPDDVFLLDRLALWMLLLDAIDSQELPRWERLRRTLSSERQRQLLAPAYQHLPIKTLDAVALDQPVPFFRRWMECFVYDAPYWQAVDHRAHVGDAPPAHLIGGWYDIFLDGILDDYARQIEAGKQPYLTIGPWTHMDFAVQLEALRQGIPWFDAHLRGERQHLRVAPVFIFLMGANEWRTFDAWPPPTHEAHYFLQPHGKLATQAPPAHVAPNGYRYDPADPTPNVGGPLLSPAAGAVDNRALAARSDVLVYTSPPLAQPLEVIGAVRLVLYLRSSLAHTDFFGRLCDVHPDGRSINLCDGLLRLHPDPNRSNAHPLPDGTRRIEIALSHTAHRFQTGHRIQLLVSSGAHPRFARNPGSGEPLVEATTLRSAEQTIYHDLEHPSVLALPVAS